MKHSGRSNWPPNTQNLPRIVAAPEMQVRRGGCCVVFVIYRVQLSAQGIIRESRS